MNIHTTPARAVDQIDLENAIERTRHAVGLVRLALTYLRSNDAEIPRAFRQAACDQTSSLVQFCGYDARAAKARKSQKTQ
ncbi:hypothetical protein FO470_14485 [Starkeya sp. 3C]|uniref:Uncharacterized protein n=1 Tax=Ancylobacter moscoviensis TaxID=2597768 RepID=A0ABY3DUU0_9HYPH|nr:hypothetical protein [Ancylobacter moscoviensis]TSJ61667.1 hypothetical protein FO470_14485 [Ancylobacter moscoviensis]